MSQMVNLNMIQPTAPFPPSMEKLWEHAVENIIMLTDVQLAFDINMGFYWVHGRRASAKFIDYWLHDTSNLSDYPTKHHSSIHHKIMRTSSFM